MDFYNFIHFFETNGVASHFKIDKEDKKFSIY